MLNREILFRGQMRRRGEKVRMDGTPMDSIWVHGGVFPGSGDFSIIYGKEDKYCVYSDTVGQFTGLYDTTTWEELTEDERLMWLDDPWGNEDEWTGRRIFEGDIVAVNAPKSGNEYLQRIEWNEEIGSFCSIDISNRFKGNRKFRLNKDCQYKVVGNIYDNPELIRSDS